MALDPAWSEIVGVVSRIVRSHFFNTASFQLHLLGRMTDDIQLECFSIYQLYARTVTQRHRCSAISIRAFLLLHLAL